jgi:hypothetical protein
MHLLKSSAVDSKPSAIDLLFLKQEELNMKHQMKVKNDLHVMEIKKLEEEKKINAKSQRLSMFAGGSRTYGSGGMFSGESYESEGKWSPRMIYRMVCISIISSVLCI